MKIRVRKRSVRVLNASLFVSDSLIDIVHLFAHTMHQKYFIRQLSLIYSSSAIVSASRSVSKSDCDSHKSLASLMMQPLSLDSLCRKQIYLCLNGHLAPNVNKLRLPRFMQEKLLHFS